MSIRPETFPPAGTDGAVYQSWLRRHIATLERLQVRRIETVAQTKLALDRSIERAALEITNLKAQQTIGSIR